MNRRSFIELLAAVAGAAGLPLPPSIKKSFEADIEPDFWLKLNGVARNLLAFKGPPTPEPIDVTHFDSPSCGGEFIKGFISRPEFTVEVDGEIGYAIGEEIVVETGHRTSGWSFSIPMWLEALAVGSIGTTLTLVPKGPAQIHAEGIALVEGFAPSDDDVEG